MSAQILLGFFIVQTVQKGFYSIIIKGLEDQDDDDDGSSAGANGKTKERKSLIIS